MIFTATDRNSVSLIVISRSISGRRYYLRTLRTDGMELVDERILPWGKRTRFVADGIKRSTFGSRNRRRSTLGPRLAEQGELAR